MISLANGVGLRFTMVNGSPVLHVVNEKEAVRIAFVPSGSVRSITPGVQIVLEDGHAEPVDLNRIAGILDESEEAELAPEVHHWMR